MPEEINKLIGRYHYFKEEGDDTTLKYLKGKKKDEFGLFSLSPPSPGPKKSKDHGQKHENSTNEVDHISIASTNVSSRLSSW